MSCRRRRYAPPSSGVRMSGSETISISGTRAPVEVHERRLRPGELPFVDELPGVLLHVDPRDPDPLRLPVDLDVDVAAQGERQLVLGDLVRLGEVRVEVVLPGEDAPALHRAGGGERRPDRELHHLAVEHREHARACRCRRGRCSRWGRPRTPWSRRRRSCSRVESWAWTSSPMTVSNSIVSYPSSGATRRSGRARSIAPAAVNSVSSRKRFREKLRPDGQPLRGETARHGDPRDAGQVARDRVDVGQVHRERIARLLPEAERRRRAWWG